MSFKDMKKIVLKGECMWATVITPRPDYNNKLQYSIDLALSDDDIQMLIDEGLPKLTKLSVVDADGNKERVGISNSLWKKAECTKFLTFRRDVESKAGKEIPPVEVFGSDRKPFSKLIGNGSIVKAVIEIIPYEFQSTKGIRPRLAAVQVIELKEYVSKKSSFSDMFDDEGTGAVDTEEESFADVLDAVHIDKKVKDEFDPDGEIT